MLGMSPTKILFTIAIIAIVWYGFKMLGRIQDNQKKQAKQPSQSNASNQSSDTSAKEADYEELVKCSNCGNYVLAGKKCGCGEGEL